MLAYLNQFVDISDCFIGIFIVYFLFIERVTDYQIPLIILLIDFVDWLKWLIE